jgi:hypothetical protein
MSDKRRTFGQFETPPDVADLLLGFCLRRPGDRLLDPSCGSGAFLERAALMQRWLAPDVPQGDTLWGVELDAEAAALARETLPQAQIVNDNFFEWEPGRERIFDAIIGNPPYTRAEWIGRLTVEGARGRQMAIFENQEASPSDRKTGGREGGQAVPGGVLDRRAGLYAYFFVHGSEFVREGGRFGFVVPNSWLDVAYGERLKQFLLEHYKILAIVESNVERWFKKASVNTCLLVLEKCQDASQRARNRVRLVRLKEPLSKLIPYELNSRERPAHLERLTGRMLPNRDMDGAEMAIRVVDQSSLASTGKWGVALRAPAVYRKRSQDPGLHPLGSWARIQRGYTTGANAFFFLNSETISKWGIETRFRRPLLKSLRNIRLRQVTFADCSLQVLLIPPKSKLSGTAAAEYIAWGEAQGFHRRRTCASRNPWFRLPAQEPGPIVLPKGIWDRHFGPLLQGQIMLDQQLYQVHLAEGISPLAAAALLNSSWLGLQLELHGRVNFGEGVLWLAGYEVESLQLPDPRYAPPEQLAEITRQFTRQLERPVGKVDEDLARPAWKAFNAAVFDLLGLTASEGAAVNEALLERVAARKAKARASR